ncbi:MAG: alpha/beta hydrolase fold domain-containing protein [Acidimicrobiales bacterium]
MFSHQSTTPETAPLTYGAAPPIDPRVGPNDPHNRPLDARGNEIQRVWLTDPIDNQAQRRPAIIFVHGGGFRGGIGNGYPLLTRASAYAERGYVLFSIEYRTDTTSDCQAVQDYTGDPDDPEYLALKTQCLRGITAAQQDAQAAVRWVRRHAADRRIDPNKVAMGGFSAGAITAANVAYSADGAGEYAYSSEDDPGADSRIDAAFGSSGCTYDPTLIGRGDSPVSFIHGELDVLVDYDSCVVPSFETARAAGLVAELSSYCGDSRHATTLYKAHMAATDAQWTTFLARELRIYSGMRPPSASAFCP